MYNKSIFHRLELLLGKEIVSDISSKKVILFGVGGVGSWCAESLIRSGIHHLTIVDPDVICITNLNRQLQTDTENIGRAKVDELKKRLKKINPDAEIIALKKDYSQENFTDFNLYDYDYVIDAIDSLKNKIHLLKTCLSSNIKIFSSMGAASRIDPTKVLTAKISKTFNCPLARRVRRALKKEKIYKEFICVFSTEEAIKPIDKNDICDSKNIVNGTVAHIPAIFGFTLAGLVICDIKKAY